MIEKLDRRNRRDDVGIASNPVHLQCVRASVRQALLSVIVVSPTLRPLERVPYLHAVPKSNVSLENMTSNEKN